MTKFEIIAQVIGIFAMAFNILSYQQKTPGKVMAFQFCGASLFAVNFFMLGATVGGIMNIIAAVRALIFANPKKFRADHIAWLIGFIVLYGVSYLLTFICFDKEWTLFNGIIELLPVIAMTVSTVSYRLQNAKAIRLFGLIVSPSWLVYNIINVAIGAIICEVLSLGSIIIGLVRYDWEKKENYD